MFPIINGEQMYESLKRLGVPTLLVVYPGQYHQFHRPSFIRGPIRAQPRLVRPLRERRRPRHPPEKAAD